MKAITILQPWASLIACGAKHIETRSWATKYRGPLAIHAAKSLKAWHMDQAWKEPFYSALESQHNVVDGKKSIQYPFPGSVIAIAELIGCQEMTMDKIVVWRDVYGKNEIVFGDFQPGRFAWILDNVRTVKPVQAKGRQRLWEWEP